MSKRILTFKEKALFSWGFLSLLSLPLWYFAEFTAWVAAVIVWGFFILLGSPLAKMVDDASIVAAHKADEIRKKNNENNSDS